MKKIIIATKNKHKLEEIINILNIKDVQFLSLADFPEIGDIEENGNTFIENAKIKALQVAKYTDSIVIADDSGLEIEAFGNRPGIYSARFIGEKTNYKIKNEKILELLKLIPDNARKARFVCAIAVCTNKNDCEVVLGTCEGYISHRALGKNGFGYDPIFFVSKYNKTYAEIDDNIKNEISHRSIALKKAKNLIISKMKEM